MIKQEALFEGGLRWLRYSSIVIAHYLSLCSLFLPRAGVMMVVCLDAAAADMDSGFSNSTDDSSWISGFFCFDCSTV